MKKYKLSELGAVGRGKSKHRPRNDPQLFGGEYPFIQTGDVKHAPLYVNSHSQTYNEKGLEQSKLWPAGTLCITIAANIADTAILSYPACFPDSVIGFNAYEGVADTKYVKYCLDTFQLQMRSISQGTTQDNMSLEKLLSIKFPVPGIEQQRKVAAILTTYDDLIENNKRRIALLENMVEEIYREWFVRFRFPGWQEVEFEKGLPASWVVAQGDDLFEVVKGKSYSSEEISDQVNDGRPFINLKNFNRGGGYRSNGLKYFRGEFRDRQQVNRGDVVMAVTDMTQNREVIGRAARVPYLGDTDGIISLDVVKISAFSWPDLFTYVHLRYSGISEALKELANGANVLHLKPDLIGKQKYLVPDTPTVEEFVKLVEPFYEQIEKLEQQIDMLEYTKNQLLPRLISGKLSVENLDIQFPPSMQSDESDSANEAAA